MMFRNADLTFQDFISEYFEDKPTNNDRLIVEFLQDHNII